MRDYPQIYSQRDPRWANQRLGTVNGNTIGQAGCYDTCFAMKASFYGHLITPNALDDIFTNQNIYINDAGEHTQPSDLLADNSLTQVYPDVKFQQTYNFSSGPADLNLLKNLSNDPSTTVTLELDFDHDPNDGIQTHFVELHSFDDTSLRIYDPWDGLEKEFSQSYGTNPGLTIQKFVVYQGQIPQPVQSQPVLSDDDLRALSVIRDGYRSILLADGTHFGNEEAVARAGVDAINKLAQAQTDLDNANITINSLKAQLADFQASSTTQSLTDDVITPSQASILTPATPQIVVQEPIFSGKFAFLANLLYQFAKAIG